jgi:hypothetical protein
MVLCLRFFTCVGGVIATTGKENEGDEQDAQFTAQNDAMNSVKDPAW